MPVVKQIDHFFTRLTRIEYSVCFFIVVPIIVGCVRVYTEDVIYKQNANITSFIFHTVMFYLLLQMMMLLSLRLSTGKPYRELMGAVTVGLVLGWLPPILDLFLPSPGYSGYHYLVEFNWHFFVPTQMLGESVTLWLVILWTGIYVAWLTRSIGRMILAMLLCWVSLQIGAWGWRAFTVLFVEPGMQYNRQIMELIGLIAVFAGYSALNWSSMKSSLKRFNHALPMTLTAMIGAKLAGGELFFIVVIGIVVLLAILQLTVANDYFDRHQDSAAGGTPKGATREDMIFASYIQVLMVFWMLFFYPNGFVAIVLLFALWTGYHLPELRFKRLFCLNYKIEGFSGATCFLFGLYVNGPLPEGNWAPIATLLVMGGFSAGSMFKDFKDIDQDRADRIGTFYTRGLKKGRSLAGLHRFVALMTSSLLIFPVGWLIYMGNPWWQVVLPAVLIPIPALSLLTISSRKIAVESTIWTLSIYLAIIYAVAPRMI